MFTMCRTQLWAIGTGTVDNTPKPEGLGFWLSSVARITPGGGRESNGVLPVICGPQKWKCLINTWAPENLVEDEWLGG